MSSSTDSDVRDISEGEVEVVGSEGSDSSERTESCEDVDVIGVSDNEASRGKEIVEASSSRNPEGSETESDQPATLPYTEIRSKVTQLEVDALYSRCHIPRTYRIRIPEPEERMHNPPSGSIAMPLPSFYCGFRLPIPEVVRSLLNQIGLNPTQLLPNSYALLLAFIIKMRCWAHPASFTNFTKLFSCQPSPRSGSSNNAGFYYITARPKKKLIDIPSTSYGKGWKSKWVIVEPPFDVRFEFRRSWASGKVNNRSRGAATWDEEFFKNMLEYKPLRPLELCEEIVLARAGLSPAKFRQKDLDKIKLDPDFLMAARNKAIEADRAKREAKAKKAEEGTSKVRAPGAGKPLHLLYSGQTSKQSTESSAPTKKRSAEPESSPQPVKKRAPVEKEKVPSRGKDKIDVFDPARLIPGPMPLVRMPETQLEEKLWELPKYKDPERLPGVPNDVSFWENIGHPAGLEAFRSTLFPKDIEACQDWKISHLIRQYAQLTVMNNNMVFALASRANNLNHMSRDLHEENKKLSSEMGDRETELSKAEEQITALVTEKSRLEELAEKHRRESLEAFRRGEEKGRMGAIKEKEAEYKAYVPAIRLKAVEEFVRGPVFTRSTLIVGANDVDSGWNRALGQLRTLGVKFDESKLDKSLDENLQPFAEEDDDEEEAFPDVEGQEFESMLDIVEEMADRAREKQEAAALRRSEAQAEVIHVTDLAPSIRTADPPALPTEENRAAEGPSSAPIEMIRGEEASTSTAAPTEKS